jgi:hypothetical protein
MRVENRLITKRMPWHANMTDMNHLGAALIAKPEIFADKMTQLFTSKQYYSGNPLTTVMRQYMGERTITKSAWEWSLRGAYCRPLVVMENVEASSNTTLGKGRTDFKVKLDEDWFVPGDVLSPGNTDYQIRVVESPFRQGNGYVYKVRLMDDAFDAFLPLIYVSVGQKWGKLYSMYEEAAEQSGSTQYSTPFTLANHMGRYRKKYKITGDAANEVLAIKVVDSEGNMHDTWLKYAEVEYWRQWYQELERGYWYAKATNTVMGASGRPIYSGAGIREQLKDAHNYKYSHLTTRLIEEFLMDIFYSRVEPGSGREVVGFSGEYGMLNFHRAVTENFTKSGFIQVVTDTFVNKTSSPYNTNALAYGYQFTEYRMANGATMKLIHNPLYDDREINFEIDPVTGFPKESQRITFLDLAKSGGKNIELLTKKNSMKLGYVGGLHTPYGPVTGNKLMSHSGDYYEMHVQVEKGAHIDDVSRCGELILGRN